VLCQYLRTATCEPCPALLSAGRGACRHARSMGLRTLTGKLAALTARRDSVSSVPLRSSSIAERQSMIETVSPRGSMLRSYMLPTPIDADIGPCMAKRPMRVD